MKTKLWRLGDSDNPESSEALDELLATLLSAGVNDDTLRNLERLFVSLHGSSAWNRLQTHIVWDSFDCINYANVVTDSRRWEKPTAADILRWSSVEVVEEP